MERVVGFLEACRDDNAQKIVVKPADWAADAGGLAVLWCRREEAAILLVCSSHAQRTK